MRDHRQQFGFQYLDDLRAIRASCPKANLTSALAVYLVLTELAAEQYRSGGREGFVASRKAVAEAAGVSLPTLDKAIKRLADVHLIGIERRREGTTDLPSRYCLTPGQLISPPAKPKALGLDPSRAGETATTRDRKGANAPNAREPDGFDDWLEHHCSVTGKRVMAGQGTQARKRVAAMYGERRSEYPDLDLKLVSLGAMADDRRRERGYTDPESVLRPMAVPKLLDRGRAASNGSVHQREVEEALARAPELSETERAKALASVGL